MKTKVAVLFGGRSPEHEISIITGIQVLNALKKTNYEVIPIYIGKDGVWIKGDDSFSKPETFRNIEKAIKGRVRVFLPSDPNSHDLVEVYDSKKLFHSLYKEKIDIFFPTFHGRYGEDGSIQGLFEMAGVAYVGCNVQASAIGMDKIVSKKIAKCIGIPVLEDMWLSKEDWVDHKSSFIKEIEQKLKFPVFVKPARLGSSIGIKRVVDRKELVESIEVALFYDSKVMIERGLEKSKEINISLLGNYPYEVSACEQPVMSGDILTFTDKYMTKNGPSEGMATAKRIVPAPINNNTRQKIENYSKLFFAEIGGEGMARVDFLVTQNEKEIYFNEINTLPGSLAFYLWREVGVTFDKLVDKLIKLGFEKAKLKQNLITNFKSNVLTGFGSEQAVKF